MATATDTTSEATETGVLKDPRTYRVAAFTLKTGMYLSLAAMLGGLAWWFAAGAPGGNGEVTRGIAPERIPIELSAGNPMALLDLGVLVLLATPGITLLAEIATFVAARNWRYAGIASLVGLILLLSVALSFGWLRFF